MGESEAQVARWREFRAAREATCREPYGWLTLHGFAWLPTTPSLLPGLPGRWWSDGASAYVDISAGSPPDARLVPAGADGTPEPAAATPPDGVLAADVEEDGRLPWLWAGETVADLLRRGGRHAVRSRSRTSPRLESFAGIPTYDYDPAFVVTGTFVPYDAPRRVEIATAREDLRMAVETIGEVRFSLGGQPQRLAALDGGEGLWLLFHDPTNGTETETWRHVLTSAPSADGTVEIDLNRALNFWFAYSDAATCPAPPEGNAITVPVRAGERR